MIVYYKVRGLMGIQAREEGTHILSIYHVPAMRRVWSHLGPQEHHSVLL